VRHLRRGGRYLRVADPGWEDPLDGRFAQRSGGRWNPPRSFPVVYLSRSVATARANVYRLLVDLPYGPEDLDPVAAPVLVDTTVPTDRYVDAITSSRLASLGLPATYPRDAQGRLVSHERCEDLGQTAWEAGEPGIACLSAAPTAPARAEELAWFERGRPLVRESVAAFEDWFW
jgi:RES domain